MATTNGEQLTFDEVLDRVLAADPQSFYAQAKAFEEAEGILHDAKNLLAKQRRALEEGWSSQTQDRFTRLDRLVRHVDVLTADLPAYPLLLRRAGDAVVDSRQRLLSLRHMPDTVDQSALRDRDKQARKILGELSTSYRRVGDELPALPERTATGQLLSSPVPRRSMAGNPSGANASLVASSPRPWSSRKGVPSMAFAPVQDNTQAGVQARSEQVVAFGRFAPFAAQPAPATSAKSLSFNGFAGLADPMGPTAVAQRPTGNGLAQSAEDRKEKAAREHDEVTYLPAGLDNATMSIVDIPAKLEAAPVAAALATTPPATIAGPVVASAAAAAGVPATTVAASLSAAPVAAGSVATAAPVAATPPTAASIPAAPPTTLSGNSAPPPPLSASAAAPASPPGPPAAPATSGPQPSPLAMAASGNLAPGSASASNMMRPPLGATLAPGLVGHVPIGRGAEVWLRADTADWTQNHQAGTRPGRDDAIRCLGFTGDARAADHGKDAR